MSEARVAELIQAAVENLQQQMSSALRAEFSATAVAAEARLGHVQSEMSADLRREFEATRESFDERIRTLTNSIDFEVTKKFNDVEAASKAERLGTQQALEHKIGELTAA